MNTAAILSLSAFPDPRIIRADDTQIYYIIDANATGNTARKVLVAELDGRVLGNLALGDATGLVLPLNVFGQVGNQAVLGDGVSLGENLPPIGSGGGGATTLEMERAVVRSLAPKPLPLGAGDSAVEFIHQQTAAFGAEVTGATTTGYWRGMDHLGNLTATAPDGNLVFPAPLSPFNSKISKYAAVWSVNAAGNPEGSFLYCIFDMPVIAVAADFSAHESVAFNAETGVNRIPDSPLALYIGWVLTNATSVNFNYPLAVSIIIAESPITAITVTALNDVCTYISIANCLLSATALNNFFTALPENIGACSIEITGNPGTATCNQSLATAKGYTITV